MNEGTKLLTRDDLAEEIQTQSLKTHQAMHKEMLANEKKNDQQIQFDAILTGRETLSKNTINQLSQDYELDRFGKK